MRRGWVKIFRKISGWKYYRNANIFRVMMHLLFHCAYESTVFKDVWLPPGTMVTNLNELAQCLGLSIQQIRSALKALAEDGCIESRRMGNFLIVVVKKWEFYQINFYRDEAGQQSADMNLSKLEFKQDHDLADSIGLNTVANTETTDLEGVKKEENNLYTFQARAHEAGLSDEESAWLCRWSRMRSEKHFKGKEVSPIIFDTLLQLILSCGKPREKWRGILRDSAAAGSLSLVINESREGKWSAQGATDNVNRNQAEKFKEAF